MNSTRTRRSCLIFSLRSFLLFVTVLLVLLSIQIHRTREQAKAIAAIEDLGGQVNLAEPDEPLPKWLEPVYGRGRVKQVGFQMLPLTDEQAKDLPMHLAKLPAFDLLSFDRTKIGDTTLERIKHLRNFTILNLDSTNITDTGVEHLMELPQLESLSIVFTTRLTSAGFRRLADHPNLKRVVANPTEAQASGYQDLVQALHEREKAN